VAGDPSSRAVSRHSNAAHQRFDVRASNLNAWCRLPGNPFSPGLALMPNGPAAAPVSASFGPLSLPEHVDTVTCLLSSRAARRHANRIRTIIQIVSGAEVLGEAEADLGWQDAGAISVGLSSPLSGTAELKLSVTLEADPSDNVFPSLILSYTLAYAGNPLVSLFNASGSDKGTEHGFGGGVPHCYALEYFRLFSPFREDSFSLLEIGLQNASKEGGTPDDIPSLRVWRDFFPRALCFGYDTNDFSAFDSERIATFQGDQASRSDLNRFLERSNRPAFRLILDDGSHASSHQQISLSTLFSSLEPGGLYLIEDLNWQPYPESPTTLEVLLNYLSEGKIVSPHILESDARRLERDIESVSILRPNDADFAVLRKRR
jgi:hypothetical protein